MANRLADETSPYLLQHADNPVDWYPWGEEALARAREEDRPILLSIGYSACHWCHVMERESFEDPEIAALMNEHFVSIKVDREERPDLDSIYMEAVPGDDRAGRLAAERLPHAGAGAVLRRHLLPARVAHGHAELALGARGGRRGLGRAPRRDRAPAATGSPSACSGGALLEPSEDDLDPAAARRAPWRRCATTTTARTAASAARRSSRPRRRSSSCCARGETEMTAPHAARAWPAAASTTSSAAASPATRSTPLAGAPLREDALRQRAARARLPARLAGHRASRCSARSAEETLDWVLREMRGPEGGFYSALDADSEGEEGKFYVWTRRRAARGARGEPDADEAIAWFGATDRGNFEGREHPGARARASRSGASAWRERLYDVRAQRVWPGLDDKRLTSWNALMISALADAGAVLERADYLDAARAVRRVRAARAARRRAAACCAPGRTAGRKLNAYLEDHAFLLEALLSLYEATFEPRWFAEARALADTMIERFADEEQRRLLRDRRPTTSSSSRAARTSRTTRSRRATRAPPTGCCGSRRSPASTRYEERAESRPAAAARARAQAPAGVRPPAPGARLPARAGEGGGAGRATSSRPLERVVRDEFRPHLVLAGGEPDGVPLLEGREPVDGRAAAYVCEQLRLQGAR